MSLARILSLCCAIGLTTVWWGGAVDAQQPATTSENTDAPLEPLLMPLDGRDGRELLLRNFRPQAKLRVPENPRDAAKFPVVDVHTHLSYRLKDDPEALDAFVELMDRNNIAVCCSLDGRLGDKLQQHMRYLWTKYRDRFVIYANIDWQGAGDADDPATWACNQPGFVRQTVMQLEAAAEQGISGLKIFKGFGLGYRGEDRDLLAIDDLRWDPIWEACGRLGLPIIMHVADPAAFFDPIDPQNERWEELSRHPDWSFHGDDFPSREALLEARNRVIERHPKTKFIGAHVANNSEDLETVAAWLDRYPNLSVEFASRIGELGRQPYSARDFIIKYADRVMFGTDGPWPETRIRLYWRFLETRDQYFPYSEKEFPPQGLWQIYGLYLPDDVLRKVYSENAARLIPGVRQRLGS
ncbi:Amidohydrolase [Rosistilla carotiformis]|uniref:Amidohydrolase n=1 Tax=Rosistilla carotiformis TaxID=2528017 RepID=A0A518JPK3_9BACT|nr:Amidohydrolase [Rosistilla carotiformis]